MSFNEVRARLLAGASEGVYSGAALHVRRGPKVILETFAGRTRADVPDAPVVGPHTHFDLASLTKVVCTTTALMRLCARGELSLAEPLGKHLREAPSDKRGLTLGQLCAHVSGLVPHRPYFERLASLSNARRFDEARQRLVQLCLNEPLAAPPGTCHAYSDLGFILLGAVLERHTGERLDRVFTRLVAKPLGLRSTFFIDRAGPRGRAEATRAGAATEFAATERCPWRQKVLSGEVHDDNAYTAGGICGHAGLFGTASDLGRFGAELCAAWREQSTFLSKSLLTQFLRADPFQLGGAHAYGFDVSHPPGSQAGDGFPGAVGHLGFTGTSLWIDLPRQLSIVLLTNRVHPSRDNQQIREFRPMLHDALAEALAEA